MCCLLSRDRLRGTDNTLLGSKSSDFLQTLASTCGTGSTHCDMSTRPTTVTIKDVARESGVSPMTVSRVINNDHRVRPETRRRVQEAIAELGYVPSRLARGLSARKTGTIAMIVPDVANPFFTLMVRGAEDVARRAGYRIILCDTRADLTLERDVIEEMIAHRVEGIAIAPVSDRSRLHLRRLARFGVPF